MQDDWARWLPIAEFADNNAQFSSTGFTPFFANKSYHPKMNIGPDDANYATIKEKMQRQRAEAIAGHISEILDFIKLNAEHTQELMTNQVNSYRKDVTYKIGDKIFLASKFIRISRPCKKLDDKFLGPYKVIGLIGNAYKLELPPTMKIHFIFYP